MISWTLFPKRPTMNIKYEAKYKEMLASCDNMNKNSSDSLAIANAFHLIESHLREQFTYEFNVPATPLTRDDNVIKNLMFKLEQVCQKAKESIAIAQSKLDKYAPIEYDYYALEHYQDIFKELNKYKKFKEVEFKLQFLKQIVLPLPRGSNFPLICSSKTSELDDSKIKTYSGTVSGTVSSTGHINGRYNQGGAYTVKGDTLHTYLHFNNYFDYSFPTSHFLTSTMHQIYSTKTFNTDLGYDLDKGSYYVVVECRPGEKDPLYQSTIQALIDPKHFGIWQAHSRENYKTIQGQKQNGFFKNMFKANPYAPYNMQVKKLLEQFLSQKQQEQSAEELLKKQFQEKVNAANQARSEKRKQETQALLKSINQNLNKSE